MVSTDYRPKEHDLVKLEKQAITCNSRFSVFPKTTKEERNLFKLLKRAYVDARYKMDEFEVTKEQLEYLVEKVEVLKELTGKICKERILDIGDIKG